MSDVGWSKESQCTRKVRYDNQRAACDDGQNILKKGKRRRLWAYSCEHCDGWHLTSHNYGTAVEITESLARPDDKRRISKERKQHKVRHHGDRALSDMRPPSNIMSMTEFENLLATQRG